MSARSARREDATGRPWWQTGVIYQIYPRSFADGNDDGVGDLRGIIDRLDYLTGLGIDAMWLSPIFLSPMADFGYDVASYTDIDPVFGTESDFGELIARAHEEGLRVILDLVPNHTSDEHPWFVEARWARSHPRRDWYVWRDPGPDGPPNDWESFFGGPAWEWDETTDQYYLHLFHRKQPDLNWRNPDVREAIYDVMRFWFDRGVDGFRIDVIWLLIKDADFADNPTEPPLLGDDLVYGYLRPGFEDRPEVQQIVKEMRRVADEYSDKVLIGEIYLPIDRLVRYYGESLDGIHLPFNFGLVNTGIWTAEPIRRLVSRYEKALPHGAWPNWVLGNHDKPRIATRAGDRARLAQMLLLTLRGTPTCYYGDELGMKDGEIPDDAVRDPQTGAGSSRDGARTPMPWDDGPNAGFSTARTTPWLPVGPNRSANVAGQEGDPRSVLSMFRRLLDTRRENPALSIGEMRLVDAGDSDVMSYLRVHGDETILVVLNFDDRGKVIDLTSIAVDGRVLCSTGMDRTGPVDLGHLDLRADEGLVIEVS